MAARRGMALVCIALPIGALLSLGCGLFILPVAGPKAALHNAQRIEFTLHVVGKDGKLLDGVMAKIYRHKDNLDVFGESDSVSDPEQRTIDGELHYKSVGAYAVEIDLEKSEYVATSALFGNEDDVHLVPGYWMSMIYTGRPVNVRTHPEVVIQMFRKEAQGRPSESAESSPSPPAPAGPTYPTPR
ncbi:MAG TPA: hypothetical protein VH253_01360 [Phycisphaerae bacterium]|nr:hypothetical protein [Phycisphaerae bacterium]